MNISKKLWWLSSLIESEQIPVIIGEYAIQHNLITEVEFTININDEAIYTDTIPMPIEGRSGLNGATITGDLTMAITTAEVLLNNCTFTWYRNLVLEHTEVQTVGNLVNFSYSFQYPHQAGDDFLLQIDYTV